MQPSKLKTVLGAILACLLWSTAFVGIKIGLAYMTPLDFAGVRFLISGLMLIPFAGNPAAGFRMVRRHFGFVLKVALLYSRSPSCS